MFKPLRLPIRFFTSRCPKKTMLIHLTESLCVNEKYSSKCGRYRLIDDVTSVCKDWTEIKDAISNFGTPEVADQMLGTAKVSITEDVSSKCFRMPQVFETFSLGEFLRCVQDCESWSPEDAKGSYGLRSIFEGIDAECFRRNISGDLESIVAFHLCRCSNHVSKPFSFPLYTSRHMLERLNEGSLDELIPALLLVAFCQEVFLDNLNLKDLLDKINFHIKESIESFSVQECTACYSGLQIMSPNNIPEVLINRMRYVHGQQLP